MKTCLPFHKFMPTFSVKYASFYSKYAGIKKEGIMFSRICIHFSFLYAIESSNKITS